MEKTKNINIIAIIIGFSLIFVIAAITIARPYFSKQSNVAVPISATDYSSQTNPDQISGDELLSRITSDKNLVIIDIRSADAFTKEHIASSQNIPIEEIFTKIFSLDKNKNFIIIDSGLQEGLPIALELFPQNGFKNTLYLRGGFPDWKLNNNPFISAGDPTSFTDQSKVTYIDSADLKTLINKENNLLLIDLRSAENYASGHIKNSANIPLGELEARKTELPIGKKIILCDKDGLWAFQGAVRLFDLGFFNTLSLSDGIDGWKQKNFELVK